MWFLIIILVFFQLLINSINLNFSIFNLIIFNLIFNVMVFWNIINSFFQDCLNDEGGFWWIFIEMCGKYANWQGSDGGGAKKNVRKLESAINSAVSKRWLISDVVRRLRRRRWRRLADCRRGSDKNEFNARLAAFMLQLCRNLGIMEPLDTTGIRGLWKNE